MPSANPLTTWPEHRLRRSLLILQFATRHPWGDVGDLDFRREVETTIESALHGTGTGWVDGGDIGSGTVNIYVVPKRAEALDVVLGCLEQRGLLERATVAIRPPEGQYEVLWPKGVTGTYTAENELHGLPRRPPPEPGGEREAAVLYIGMIIGGGSIENDHMIEGVEKLRAVLDKVQRSTQDADDFGLDLVFHIPGPILGNTFRGIRTGRFSKEERLLQVQIALSEDLSREATEPFLDDALRQAVGLAERSLRRRKLAWSVERLRAAVEEVIARRRSDP